jgi:hypothetical protein
VALFLYFQGRKVYYRRTKWNQKRK